MGFRTVVSKDDLLKGEIIPPGWYPMEFIDYKEEAAQTDKSTNLLLTFKVLDGEQKGKTAQTRFNEKALGYGKKLWPLLIKGFDSVNGGEVSTPVIQGAIGTKLKIYIETKKSDKGNDFNSPADFQPLAM